MAAIGKRDCNREKRAMPAKTILFAALLVALSAPALAQLPIPLPLPLPLPQGSPEERAACQPDVQRYCESALPDTMRVLQCLQANRRRISVACRRVLENHGQ
jgi:hypothetical protein